MRFESLLNAVESYASARELLNVKSSGGGSEWDCGLSGEFGDAYSVSWERGRKLAEAKEQLRATLEAYIDERVGLALRGAPTE